MRKPFSQRYGYYKPTDIIHREELTGEILNSVMNATSDMLNNYSHFQFSNFEQRLTAEFQLKYLTFAMNICNLQELRLNILMMKK